MDQTILLVTIVALLVVLIILVVYALVRSQPKVSMIYNYDFCEKKGLIKDSTKVVFKARVVINNIPQGEPIILGTHEFSEIDNERLTLLIQKQVMPLLKEATNLTEAVSKIGVLQNIKLK